MNNITVASFCTFILLACGLGIALRADGNPAMAAVAALACGTSLGVCLAAVFIHIGISIATQMSEWTQEHDYGVQHYHSHSAPKPKDGDDDDESV